jgi:hypothetical protein
MTPTSEQEATMRAAIAGIPKVVSAIAALPKKHEEQAFKAVEQSYHETVRNLDYPEASAEAWVLAVMFSIRAEVENTEIPVGC